MKQRLLSFFFIIVIGIPFVYTLSFPGIVHAGGGPSRGYSGNPSSSKSPKKISTTYKYTNTSQQSIISSKGDTYYYNGPNGGNYNPNGCRDYQPNNTNKSSLNGNYTAIYISKVNGKCTPTKAVLMDTFKNSLLAHISISLSTQKPSTTSSTASSSSSSSSSSAPATLSCNAGWNPLNWIICGIVDGLVPIVQGIDNLINNLLLIGVPSNTQSVQPSQIFNTNNKTANDYYIAWLSFRNIALGILVIIALMIILSQASGFEIVDAYTVRKAMPRLIIAAIAISLSWQLLEFLVYMSNVIGVSIKWLLLKPFANMPDNANLSGGGDVAVSLLAALGLRSLGIFGVLSFIATAAIAVFVAFIVLILRQIVVILLIILSPIAMVSSILPNTQKIYKAWWDSFSKALIMFPLIVGLITAGRIFSVISVNADKARAANQVIGIVAYFAPYFMLPITFKLAGGIMGNVGGFIHNKHQGARSGISKYRSNALRKNLGRDMDHAERRIITKRSSLASMLNEKGSNQDNGWLKRRAYGMAARSVGGYNIEALASAKRAQVGKEIGEQIANGKDMDVRGLTVNKKTSKQRIKDGKRQFQSLGGAWVDEANVDAGYRRWGHDSFAQQAAVAYEMKKATTEDQIQNLAANYSALAESWKLDDQTAGGIWQGAAYQNQNEHLEYKYTNWKTGNIESSKANDFVTEIYEKRASYPLAQMGSNTFKQLANVYDNGDTDTKQKVQRIAENFVSRGGATNQGVVLDSEGKPVPNQSNINPAQTNQRQDPTFVQTNAAGPAHVAENIRKLAEHVGVYGVTRPSSVPPQH